MGLGALNGNSGVTNPWTGDLAEYWWTNTDIFPAGALSLSLMRQLAFEGPFSIPYIGNKVQEYRSFRGGFPSADIYSGPIGQQNWANNNGAISGLSPPLYRSYKWPGSSVNRRRLVPDLAALFDVTAAPPPRRRRLLVLG